MRRRPSTDRPTGSRGTARPPSVAGMARRDPHHGHGRLAAVLGPPPGDRVDPAVAGPSVDDVRTLPAIPPRERRRDRLADRWLPAAWRGARLDPGLPGTFALLLTAAVAAALAAVGVWWEAPRAERVPDRLAATLLRDQD